MINIMPKGFFLLTVLLSFQGPIVKSQYSYKRLAVNVTNFVAKFDPGYVSHFTLVAPETGTYVFELKQKIPTFFLELKMSSLESKRVYFYLKGFNGCEFLKNPFTNSLFNKMLKGVTGGSETYFQCPLRTQNYTLITKFTENFLPPMHPTGLFAFDTKCNLKRNNFTLLHLNWSYRVMRNSQN